MKRALLAAGLLLLMLVIGTASVTAYSPQDKGGGQTDQRGPVRYGMGGKISLAPPGNWSQGGGAIDKSTPLGKFASLVLPVFGTDVSASGGSANEVTIAADPTRPLYFVAGANASGSGHYTTTDGGQTWLRGNFSGIGDPAVTYDNLGNAYYAELTSFNCPDPVRVHKSTDGGVTWSSQSQVLADADPANHFTDKEWIAADKNAFSPFYGRIYVAGTSFHAPACDLNNYIDNREILSWSSDGGTTWSGNVTISDAAHNQNQFVNPIVANDGSVYVSYQYQNCTYNCNGLPASQMITKSTNGGVSWSPSITITGQPISYTGSSVSGYQYLYASSTTTGFRHNDQAIIGVSPLFSNQVYAVWSDGRWDSTMVYQGVTGWHADIAFTRSTDGGNTWAAPMRINDDPQGNGRDQFFPWMAVGSDGTIHVSFYDRRDGAGFQYREYYTQSTDGGLTWSANQPVSDVGTTPTSFIGDYSGLAISTFNNIVMPIWTDQRSGQQAFIDRGLLGNQGTPTATATGSATQQATNTATQAATMTSTPVATSSSTAAVTSTATATPGGCGTPNWQIGPSYTPARQYIQARIGGDGKYYTAGGWVLSPGGTTTQTDDAARFNPVTNAWEPLPTMPVAIGVYGMGAANNKIYVVGGSDIPTRTLTTTIQVFDISANTWSRGPSVPRPTGVQGPAVEAFNNKLYVIGGASNNSVYTTTDILDLNTNTWTTGAPIPQPLFLSGTTVHNGIIYVFGGGGPGNVAQDTLFAYNIATDSWTTLASANTGGLGQVGNISPYGPNTLIATDGTDSGFTRRPNTTHIYDIATNTWSLGPLLNIARYGQAQAQLPDGRVMIYGGSQAATGFVPAAGALAGRVPGVPQPPSSTSELLPLGNCNTPTATATSVAATVTGTATRIATATATACTMTFSDVHETDYFYVPVRYLFCAGVISGYADNTFRPFNNVTRAQLTKIVVLAEGFAINTEGGPHFSDVPTSYPFYPFIETAYNRGLISGYAGGEFRPGADVTRGQLSKIVVLAEGWTLDTTGGPHFTDVPSSNPFYAFIETAYNHGIISGYSDNTFRWGASATRGQISKIVYQAVTQP